MRKMAASEMQSSAMLAQPERNGFVASVDHQVLPQNVWKCTDSKPKDNDALIHVYPEVAPGIPRRKG